MQLRVNTIPLYIVSVITLHVFSIMMLYILEFI